MISTLLRKYPTPLHKRETRRQCRRAKVGQTSCASEFTEQSNSIILSKSGKAVVSSHLLLKRKINPIREREIERHLLSLSHSPLLCVFCGNICFLPCSFPSCSGRVLCVAPLLHCSSQSLSLPSCSHDAPVMTRRRWWELVSLKEWLCLYNGSNPQGEMTINKIKTKTIYWKRAENVFELPLTPNRSYVVRF